jgi:Protein of unknown function (DUF4239)
MLQSMSDWLHGLPLAWMAAVVFGVTYLVAAVIYGAVRIFATGERARSFKAVSPGLLSPLGVLLGLFVAFTAVQVWGDNERAENAVIREASALRAVTILAASFPGAPEARLRALVRGHIQDVVAQEWPMMEKGIATLVVTPHPLAEALQTIIALTPSNPGQQTAQTQIATQLEAALEARRQRILTSHSQVSPLKWLCVFVQAVCALFTIAVVHSDDRLAAAITMGVFATGVAASVLLIAAYDRPFIGELAVGPQQLLQVMPAL